MVPIKNRRRPRKQTKKSKRVSKNRRKALVNFRRTRDLEADCNAKPQSSTRK